MDDRIRLNVSGVVVPNVWTSEILFVQEFESRKATQT